MRLTMDATIKDAELEVQYKFYPARRGARDSFMGKRGSGPQLEPDEPADVDILSIKFNGEEVELTDECYDTLQEKIIQSIERRYDEP